MSRPAKPDQLTRFLRYPGSKRRMIRFLANRLPKGQEISGKLIEPFVGGGVVFFQVRPKRAVLGDLNRELIELYCGVKENPGRVWEIYRSFPSTKAGYRRVRDCEVSKLSLSQRAARSLFLNRTCFKGMWRHNANGKFNIGYGGQDRRWAIARKHLFELSSVLSRASLKCSDFEPVLEDATPNDFVFLDPPYRPGEREQVHSHYANHQFSFSDHKRLRNSLGSLDKRGVPWSLTISAHPDILKLYNKFRIERIPSGTGRIIGSFSRRSGEVLISN